MAKPWEKIAQESSGGAPWEKHAQAPVEDDGPSQLESGIRGGAQGVSLGFADEIAGAGQAAYDAAGKMSVSDIVADYVRRRDAYRADDAAAKEANPWTYGAAEVGGGIATAFVPGLNVAKGATMAGRVGKAAMIGSAMGTGMSDGDLTKGEVGQVAWDAAKGGTIGAVTQRGFEKLMPQAANAAANVADDVVDDTIRTTVNATPQPPPAVNVEEGQSFAQKIFGGAPAENADEIASAVTNISGEKNVPGYLLTNDRPKKILADTLLQQPSIGGALTRAEMKPIYDGLDNFGKEVVEQATGMSHHEVGTAVKKGVGERFKELIAPAEAIYDEVEGKFAQVPLEKLAFKRGITKLRKEIGANDITGSARTLIDNIEKTFMGVADDPSRPGVHTVAELRKFRTNLGKYLNGTASDAEQAIVGEMYGIATRERDRSILKNAVTTGKKLTRPARAESLLGKVKEADRIYREGMTEVSDALGIQGTSKQSTRRAIKEYIDETNAEQVVKDLFNRGNVEQLQRMQKTFPEQFDLLKKRAVADIVKKSSPNGKVDPSRLTKLISEQPPEVQQLLLGDLAKKAKDAQTVYGALPKDYNPSHTSHAIGWNNVFSPNWYIQNAVSIPQRMQLAGTPTAKTMTDAVKAGVQNTGFNIEVITNKLSKTPSAQKYIGALRNAATRGQEAVAATHYILSQTEPEYQKAVQE